VGLVVLPVIATTAPVKPLAFIAVATTEAIAPVALISVAVGVTAVKVRALVREAEAAAVLAYQTARVVIAPLIAHP